MGKVDRLEFLRRSGALGIAGASALGFDLFEARGARAAARPPRTTIAAGGGATIRVGYVDDFTGVFASLAKAQNIGIQYALDQAMAKNSRIRYELVKRDAQTVEKTARTETQALLDQANVDVLLGGTSSTTALAMSDIAQATGTIFVCGGAVSSALVGVSANRVTFHQANNNEMFAAAVTPALLQRGKHWHFVTAKYAAGLDAQRRLEKLLVAAGGTVVANSFHPLPMTDFHDFMRQQVVGTRADVLVFCNYGQQTANAVNAAIDLDLHKKLHFGGIALENPAIDDIPQREKIIGSIWGCAWAPDAGGKAMDLYRALGARTAGVGWRHTMGYLSAKNVIDVMNLVGSNNSEAIIRGMENHHYESFTAAGDGYFRSCDHQAVQQSFAGYITPNSKRQGAGEYIGIESSARGDVAAGSCSEPEHQVAARRIGGERVAARPHHQFISLR